MFTSMFPGKTQSEEFREAAEKDKHRKQIVNAAGKGDEKKLQLLLTKYSGINLNEKVPACPPIYQQFRLCVPYSHILEIHPKTLPFTLDLKTNHLVVQINVRCSPASLFLFLIYYSYYLIALIIK